MYKVYIIFFKKLNAVYIGCTNNIRRRKDQHNENARKLKSFLGEFLNKNKIVLKKENLKVVNSFQNREEAFKYEKELVLKFNNLNCCVLNDNYSKHCSRKGCNSENIKISKEWVIVDFIKHTVTNVISLKAYCEHNNLNYKNMNCCGNGKTHRVLNRYKVFKKEAWDQLPSITKEKYINGNFIEEIKKSAIENRIKKTSKRYLVICPNGIEIEVNNLDKFARENGINAGNLHASISTGKKAKGYIAKKID